MIITKLLENKLIGEDISDTAKEPATNRASDGGAVGCQLVQIDFTLQCAVQTALEHGVQHHVVFLVEFHPYPGSIFAGFFAEKIVVSGR